MLLGNHRRDIDRTIGKLVAFSAPGEGGSGEFLLRQRATRYLPVRVAGAKSYAAIEVHFLLAQYTALVAVHSEHLALGFTQVDGVAPGALLAFHIVLARDIVEVIARRRAGFVSYS